MDGVNVVGVQFRRAGRIYDFSSGVISVKVGDDVVVETERGPSLGKVALVKFEDKEKYKEIELKPVLRIATEKDIDDTGRLTPEYAVQFAREKVEKLGLEMNVLQSDIQFGGNKAIIYFTAPGRVDFRELVKELASGLKARVELKQIGARDESKLIGGVGICGREYCCAGFLRDFVPVSIKMAKNQNLALNPSKVSGGCGRLLCCLTYENGMYHKLRECLPRRGTRVRVIDEGVIGVVQKAECLEQSVLVRTSDGRQITVPKEGFTVLKEGEGAGESKPADDKKGNQKESKPSVGDTKASEPKKQRESKPAETQEQEAKPVDKEAKVKAQSAPENEKQKEKTDDKNQPSENTKKKSNRNRRRGRRGKKKK